MHLPKLVGLWNLQAGPVPAEQLAKTVLQLEFKSDGTWSERLTLLPDSPPSELSLLLGPAHRIDRAEGTWTLSGDILERTFAHGSYIGLFYAGGKHRSLVAVNGDRLEVACIQYKQPNKEKFVGIFVYERVRDSS